jgi:hypothetical protein
MSSVGVKVLARPSSNCTSKLQTHPLECWMFEIENVNCAHMAGKHRIMYDSKSLALILDDQSIYSIYKCIWSACPTFTSILIIPHIVESTTAANQQSLSQVSTWQHPMSIVATYYTKNCDIYETCPAGRGSSAPAVCPLCVAASWAPKPGACAVAVPLTMGALPPVPIPQLGALFVPLLVTAELPAANWDPAVKFVNFNM